jgi:hypothetical protein
LIGPMWAGLKETPRIMMIPRSLIAADRRHHTCLCDCSKSVERLYGGDAEHVKIVKRASGAAAVCGAGAAAVGAATPADVPKS